jgi:hypothetical protein
MKFWSHRAEPNDGFFSRRRADVTTLLVVLACLAAAAMETCDEVHQRVPIADSAASRASSHPLSADRIRGDQ